jgi:hypothetical protein
MSICFIKDKMKNVRSSSTFTSVSFQWSKSGQRVIEMLFVSWCDKEIIIGA